MSGSGMYSTEILFFVGVCALMCVQVKLLAHHTLAHASVCVHERQSPKALPYCVLSSQKHYISTLSTPNTILHPGGALKYQMVKSPLTQLTVAVFFTYTY